MPNSHENRQEREAVQRDKAVLPEREVAKRELDRQVKARQKKPETEKEPED